MLARSSTIHHKPSGVSLQTPLLVPAFSSKGFGVLGEGVSEVHNLLLTAAEFVTGTYLISAYDIFYKHLPPPADLPMKPELIILDSGGYEVSDQCDFSAATHSPEAPNVWSEKELRSVLADWPSEIPAVFVNYDHPKERKSLPDQVANARDLFKGHKSQLCLFLIKPENKKQRTIEKALRSAVANVDELRSFDIVGVTEKELGSNQLDRMARIARLRRSLDEAGIVVPIHVFGALDPVSSCLYFISGAELFDGLTWLRYAYAEDRCIYIQNHACLEYGLHVKDEDLRLRVMSQNYYYLERLQERMKDFEATEDFQKLPHSAFLQSASDSLDRVLKKGGS